MRARITPHIHRTPVLTSRMLERTDGAELFFKCENLQRRAGLQGARGVECGVRAFDEQRRRGVATHSSGNHGTCLSITAASRRGIPCTVVMPRTAHKKGRRAPYGGRVVECEPSTSFRARRSLPKWWPKPAPNSCIPITTGA